MRYLISISIGPVQDFIAAARKTRDLWQGSQLLCELSRAAANYLRSKNAALIFPPQATLDDPELSVANKIFASVETNAPAELAQQVQREVQNLLDAQWEALVHTLTEKKQLGLPEDRIQLGKKQINNFLEFYAAWWPWEDDLYKASRLNVERLLVGRKALRDFLPNEGLLGVPKSSLDGGREAVFDPEQQDAKVLTRLGIKPGELLDAISLIKRLEGKKCFPSVARIAADPFIRGLKGKASGSRSILQNYCKTLRDSDLVHRFEPSDFPQYVDFPYDTQLFFSDAEVKEDQSKAFDEVETSAAAAFRAEMEQIRKQYKIQPYPYCAVLAADGDNMGSAISSLDSATGHRELSEKLVVFSKQAKQIVQNNFGALVYSGGDDVLAFLPIDTCLDCAFELRAKFDEVMSGLASGHKLEPIPTLSCGIAIGHYSEHLQGLLGWARDAESDAKANGRNRLAIHLHTRSAGEFCVPSVQKWQPGTLRYWKELIDLFKKDSFPDGAIYELDRLAREFEAMHDHAQVLSQETRRILKRKRRLAGTTPISDAVIDSLLAQIETDPLGGLKRLINELLIARRIAAGCMSREADSNE